MKTDDIIVASFFGVIAIIFTVIALVVKSIVVKWICGILAILMIAFTIYTIFYLIKKNKRKPKNFNDLLAQAVKELMSKPDFSQRMEATVNKRNQLFERQRTEDSDYGYSTSNPIMTSTISLSEEYLEQLRTLDGKAFTWNRTGSFYMSDVHGVENVMVDEYQLFIDGQEYKKIYICPYGRSSSFVPQGMKLSE